MRIEFIIIICLLIGFAIGFGAGSVYAGKTAINWCVDKALWFIDIKGIELDIDEATLKYALTNYQNNINSCFPTNLSTGHNNVPHPFT